MSPPTVQKSSYNALVAAETCFERMGPVSDAIRELRIKMAKLERFQWLQIGIVSGLSFIGALLGAVAAVVKVLGR